MSNKMHTISARLTEELYIILELKAQSANMKISNYIRTIISTSQVSYNHQDSINEKLFIISKMSNNINQIAHRLNLDNLNNIVTEETYLDILDKLINIDEQLNEIS